MAEWEVWAVRDPEVEPQMECKLIEGEGLASSGDHGAAIVAFKAGLAISPLAKWDLIARLQVALGEAQRPKAMLDAKLALVASATFEQQLRGLQKRMRAAGKQCSHIRWVWD